MTQGYTEFLTFNPFMGPHNEKCEKARANGKTIVWNHLNVQPQTKTKRERENI